MSKQPNKNSLVDWSGEQRNIKLYLQVMNKTNIQSGNQNYSKVPSGE